MPQEDKPQKEAPNLRDKGLLELSDLYDEAAREVVDLNERIEAAENDEERGELTIELIRASAEAERINTELQSKEARKRAVERYQPLAMAKRIHMREPDIYEKDNGRSFFTDLYRSKESNDYAAAERLQRHQAYELAKRPDLQQRAVASTALGGLIPPQFLRDLYAKASRNGRVFADVCNNSELPPEGMSVVLPRITTPSAAGVQATENTLVTTQDVVETDLSVPVKTMAGFIPVSRQALERGAYSDQILFEDLIARYWALLDTQCITTALAQAGIATSTAGTATVAGVWPKIADVLQQINTAMGGIGYEATAIVMHPRRWGFFEAALDTSNRPLFGINASIDVTTVADGAAAGYGPVGRMHGLPVYTDANIPTNLGAATNEDRIIALAAPLVHLFERTSDPVTLSFEQQAGTSLQVQLIVYGYSAFTNGRYPAATGVVSGAGLVPPTF